MNEQDIRGLADIAVASGTATRAQADQWVTSDVAALSAEDAPSGALKPTQLDGPAHTDVAIRARLDELVRTGEMTQQQAEAAFARYGSIPPAKDESTEPAAPEKPPAALASSGAPDPFEGVTLEDGFGPPAKATDYRLDALVADKLTTAQIQNIGETLYAAKLPTPIATQIVSEIANFEARNLDEKGLRMLNQRTMAQLDRVWGAERDSKIKVARTFLRELDKVRPGVLRLLEDSGAGSSPIVIQQIALHAERINAARGKGN